MLPELVWDCRSVLPSGFIFHQGGAPAHMAKLAQDWIATNCRPSKFIGKDEWPSNSPDLNPLDYHVWRAMLERCKSFQSKPENIDELKKVLQLIWDQQPQDSINKAILSFAKRLRVCVKASVGHFEHTLKWTTRTCQILVFVITVSVSWQWKLQVAVDYSVHNWKYGI